jgi:hypothetical protein
MHCSREINSGACQFFFSAFMIASPIRELPDGLFRTYPLELPI